MEENDEKMNKYKVSEWSKAGHDFRDVFGTSIEPFFDKLLSVLSGEVKINPFMFDDYLRRARRGRGRGMSMEDVVRESYGEKGVKLLKALL
jgi:hypothetical protein